jgi:nicotinate-nucleotide adenylyltransferase
MIGIYGGTFNPIHRGHLRAAEEVVGQLGLSRMLFIPSARPPHKEAESDPIAPARDRMAWVELAVGDNPAFFADAIEVERPGPSYLIDTLVALAERFEDDELVFVVGRDAFCEMGSWRSPRALFAACHIAVTSRPPIAEGCLADWLPDCVREDVELAPNGLSARHRTANTWIRQLEITALDVSATDIRRRLARGESVRHLVPARAHPAIVASGCYNGSPGESPPGTN